MTVINYIEYKCDADMHLVLDIEVSKIKQTIFSFIQTHSPSLI